MYVAILNRSKCGMTGVLSCCCTSEVTLQGDSTLKSIKILIWFPSSVLKTDSNQYEIISDVCYVLATSYYNTWDIIMYMKGQNM